MRFLLPRFLRRGRTSSLALLGIAVAIAASVSVTAEARQSNARPMTVDDVLRMVRLGDVLISPDGSQVFYSVSELDWDENRRLTRYFMVPFAGGEARPYIGDAGGRSFRFSPDGSHLTFLRNVDDEAQVFGLPTDVGEARQLTRHKGGVGGYRWAPDSSAIFFSADEARSDEEQQEHDLGLDPVFVDEAPNGKHEARFSNLWVHDIASDAETRLTDEEFIVDAFDISPDTQRVVFAARPDDRTNYPFLSELYLYERTTGQLIRLTDNQTPERGPLWAPDGNSFLYRAPSDADFGLRSGYFWIMDATSRRARTLRRSESGRSRQRRLERRRPRHPVQRNPRHRHQPVPVGCRLRHCHPRSPIAQGSMRSRAYSADRQRVIFSYENFTTPADLWAVRIGAGDPIRLTDVNPTIGATIAVYRWRAAQLERQGRHGDRGRVHELIGAPGRRAPAAHRAPPRRPGRCRDQPLQSGVPGARRPRLRHSGA